MGEGSKANVVEVRKGVGRQKWAVGFAFRLGMHSGNQILNTPSRTGGIVAALKRKPQVVYQSIEGPTSDRLRHAGGHFELGGEDRGIRVYYFADSPLQRLYTRLRLKAGTKETEELAMEYAALLKYVSHWYYAGLEASLPSVDLDRVFSSDPSNMVGMAKSERQANHRKKYREAVDEIGHKPSILLDNFCCYEWPLDVACNTIGYEVKRARRMVRDSASRLTVFWGMG